MKTVLSVIVILAVMAGAGFVALMEKRNVGLRNEIQEIRKKTETIESFLKSEEEARKAETLSPDADRRKIINSLNMLSSRISMLENTLVKGVMANEKALTGQKAVIDESLRKISEELEKLVKDTNSKIQAVTFNTRMANIRSHIGKVRSDLLANNAGTARIELEHVEGLLDGWKTGLPEDSRKVVEELHASVRKARLEIDFNLAAGVNRVELIWHELGKMLRK